MVISRMDAREKKRIIEIAVLVLICLMGLGLYFSKIFSPYGTPLLFTIFLIALARFGYKVVFNEEYREAIEG